MAIDPLKGKENLAWAPNVRGQHTIANATKVRDALRAADVKGTRGHVVKALDNMGKMFAQGPP